MIKRINLLITNKSKFNAEIFIPDNEEELKTFEPSINLFIYNKVGETEINGRKLPLFSKKEDDGNIISDRVGIKIEDYELATFIYVLEYFINNLTFPQHICDEVIDEEKNIKIQSKTFVHVFNEMQKIFGIRHIITNNNRILTFFIINEEGEEYKISMGIKKDNLPYIINFKKKLDEIYSFISKVIF